jgi:hypothetical protein
MENKEEIAPLWCHLELGGVESAPIFRCHPLINGINASN